MPSPQQPLSRQELLAALEQGWKTYLPRLAELSEEEQTRFAQEQGFTRVQDLLVHIFAWWRLSMQRTTWLLSNPPLPPSPDHPLFDKEVDEWNAQAIIEHQHLTRAEAEAQFAATLTEFERFLRDLPAAAFEQEHIQTWMRLETMDHYEEHRLEKRYDS